MNWRETGGRAEKTAALLWTTVEKVEDAGRMAFPKLFSFLPSLLPSPGPIAVFECLLCVSNALGKRNTQVYGWYHHELCYHRTFSRSPSLHPGSSSSALSTHGPSWTAILLWSPEAHVLLCELTTRESRILSSLGISLATSYLPQPWKHRDIDMELQNGYGGRGERGLWTYLPEAWSFVEAFTHVRAHQVAGVSTCRKSLRELQVVHITFVSGLLSIKAGFCFFKMKFLR